MPKKRINEMLKIGVCRLPLEVCRSPLHSSGGVFRSLFLSSFVSETKNLTLYETETFYIYCFIVIATDVGGTGEGCGERDRDRQEYR